MPAATLGGKLSIFWLLKKKITLFRLKKDQVLECFTRAAKTVLKKTCFANALGRYCLAQRSPLFRAQLFFLRPRIWSMEYNGSGRGCGLVAADDKIHVWRDV